MSVIKIPYSDSYMDVEIEERRIKAILCPKAHDEHRVSGPQEKIVLDALENPYGSPRLRDLAEDAKKILIITSDHTRPVPTKITMPLLLNEIRSNNPGAKIKILIATGFHRLTTGEEIANKFGDELAASEDIIIHDCRDNENMVFKGILPSGGELWINSLVEWADLIAAGLKFILNVAIDAQKEIINAFAGHPVEAHLKGCSFVENVAKVKAVEADIVITSNGGYPLDQNLYQAVKGMTAAESCVKHGGVIIMVAACNDGHGGDAFYNWFAQVASPREVAERISRISQEKTVADQWEAQILARILLKCTVIVVTDKCDPDMIRRMHMLHAYNIEDALKTAEEITVTDSKITVIPDGVGVIVQ